jgi:hypothetical protein
MWLSVTSKPDHNRINHIRGTRLKQTLRRAFEEVVKYRRRRIIRIEEVRTDRTKIATNAPKFKIEKIRWIQNEVQKEKDVHINNEHPLLV